MMACLFCNDVSTDVLEEHGGCQCCGRCVQWPAVCRRCGGGHRSGDKVCSFCSGSVVWKGVMTPTLQRPA